MFRLRQAYVWMRRIAHSRGFGIQSPTDYRFVRYVINEHWPYYAYSVVGSADDWLRRKLGRLCLRLANHMQPHAVVDLLGFDDYLKAGCRRADISHTLPPSQEPLPPLILASPAEARRIASERGCDLRMLVVSHLWQHRRDWQAIISHERATTSFDLYYCGIVIFNDGRSKQHYIVNF